MKRMQKGLFAILVCAVFVFCNVSQVFAQPMWEDPREPQAISLSEPDRYDAPTGFIGPVTLAYVNNYNGYTIYNIILNFGANDYVNAIRINSFTLSNGSYLTPVVYYQANYFFQDNLSQTSGTVTIGMVYLPSTVTSVYVTTSYARMYLYDTGWLYVDNLQNNIVNFN
ncbi:MAG: hypothetical protein J5496_03375 [Lachnospiraceae bacterium]|nr:hypothetical protein [Lachnospiraceae bacterium]